jgi:hypothetical protein
MFSKENILNLISDHVAIEDDYLSFKDDIREHVSFVGEGIHKKVYKLNNAPVVIKEGILYPWSRFAYAFYYDKLSPTINFPGEFSCGGIVGKFLSVIDHNHSLYKKIYNDPLGDFFLDSGFFENKGFVDDIDEELFSSFCATAREHSFKDRQLPIVVPHYSFIGNRSLGGGSKLTYYLIQEYVPGEDISTLDFKDIPGDGLAEIAYRTLCGISDHGVLADFRPPFTSPLGWFHKTENIRKTSSNDLVLLDTDWLWRVEASRLLSGVFIPDLVVNSIKKLVVSYV